MKPDDSNSRLSDKVLEKIKSGQVKMRSKTHFLLRSLLVVAGIFIIFAGALYITSFLVFILHRSGLWYLPGFGFKGLGILFGNLPWMLVFVILLFIAVLEIMVQTYTLAYRKPLLYSALGVLALVVATGFLLKQMTLHERLLTHVEKGGFPFARPMPRPDKVHPGEIAEIISGGFKFQSIDGATLTVKLSPRTHYPGGYRPVKGDKVLVLGKIINNTIEAEGVHKLPRHFGPPPLPMQGFPPPPGGFPGDHGPSGTEWFPHPMGPPPHGLLPPELMHPGKVIALKPSSLILESPEGIRLTVKITPETKFYKGEKPLPNEKIMVLGELRNGTIEAQSISKLKFDKTMPFPQDDFPPPGK